jgi:hypothetical protein
MIARKIGKTLITSLIEQAVQLDHLLVGVDVGGAPVGGVVKVELVEDVGRRCLVVWLVLFVVVVLLLILNVVVIVLLLLLLLVLLHLVVVLLLSPAKVQPGVVVIPFTPFVRVWKSRESNPDLRLSLIDLDTTNQNFMKSERKKARQFY